MAYDVIANTTLWYTHHHLFDLPRRPRFDRHWHRAWDGYRAYNRAVADVVGPEAPEAPTVLVQDYHFSLLGRMLARARPDLRTVHFCHIPFADPDMLRVLPDAAAGELLAGLAGFGACGFHAARWAEGFRACYADAELAGGAPRRRPPSSPRSPPTRRGCWPRRPARRARRSVRSCGPRPGGAASSCGSTGWSPPRTSCAACWPSRSCWSPIPSGWGRWSMWRWSTPPRQGLADYLALGPRSRTRRSGSTTPSPPRWTPVALHMEDDRARSLAALTISDVLLVNPVRDGLNLVAKEAPLLNTADGVLVLSRQAGAWEELAAPALSVQPLRRHRHRRGAAPRPGHGPRRAGAAGRSSARSVRARTAADWLGDQLAAVGR